MKKSIFYLMAVAGVFVFAGAAQASLSDATPELTTIQLANLDALSDPPANPIEHTCYPSVKTKPGVTVFYCGTCTDIPGEPGVEPSSVCFIYK